MGVDSVHSLKKLGSLTTHSTHRTTPTLTTGNLHGEGKMTIQCLQRDHLNKFDTKHFMENPSQSVTEDDRLEGE